MRDGFVEVLLEVPVAELRGLQDPTLELYERMRIAADAKCAEVGGWLRTDRSPEVMVQEARHPLIGDLTLVASRWAVVVPEDAL